jgi:HAD superfamily phosphatase
MSHRGRVQMSEEIKSLLIFDMDGVLVDVTRSYRETVRQTSRLFFNGAGGWESLPEPLFSLVELAEVKRLGGLNNDWDLTFRIISMLLTKVLKPSIMEPLRPDFWHAYKAEVSKWDVSPLAEFLSSGPGALVRLGESMEDSYARNFYRGDVGTGNIIKQIFQEIYLGGVLFRSTYGIPPRVSGADGYIFCEAPLVSVDVLSRLHSHHVMALATGRPRSEAVFALDAHGFSGLFDFILTLDDCLAEENARAAASGFSRSLSKPDPFMLDAIAACVPETPDRLYYIGDMPDDMFAALRSGYKFTPVGVIGHGPGAGAAAKALTRAGAKILISGVDELEGVLKTSP